MGGVKKINSPHISFRDLVIHTTTHEYFGRIHFLMLFWMNDCLTLTWEEFVPLYKRLCETCEENGVVYFQFLRKTFGENRFNVDFMRKHSNIALKSSCENGNLPMLKYLKNEFGLTKEDVQMDNNDALK